MKWAALAIVAIILAGCATPARFAPTPPQVQTTPQQQPPSRYRAPLGGPYERTPEDGSEPYSPPVRPRLWTDE
jgi:hypothetical protein